MPDNGKIIMFPKSPIREPLIRALGVEDLWEAELISGEVDRLLGRFVSYKKPGASKLVAPRDLYVAMELSFEKYLEKYKLNWLRLPRWLKEQSEAYEHRVAMLYRLN